MNDSFCFRALLAIGIDMRHNVMPHLFFAFRRHVIIDIVSISLQLSDLLVCYRQAKLLFRLCKSNPQTSPGFEFFVR